MGDLSRHFDRTEFRCRGFGRAGHPSHLTPVEPRLTQRLEVLRSVVGRPLRIVSGHRCSWWNRRVGGALRSRHLVCDAADIPPGYATPELARQCGFTGVGVKAGWAVHVDVRPGRFTTWSYD